MEGYRQLVPYLQPGELYADRYRVVATIGRGGMGQVYLTEDIRLSGKRRALKLTATPAEERDSFIREAAILSELHHPHLPDIVDYYPPDQHGAAGIVMDYIPGDTLADLFERCGRYLPFVRVHRYLIQLCDVLCYLHSRQPLIVFRDLKPANVLIDRHDRAVLIDFGIARHYRQGAGADTERLGTPAFAAPEQLRGEQTDARTDLYGWGALAYHLLSGGRFAIQRKESVRRMLQADVPADFTELMESVLANDPAYRPDSAVALRELLHRFAPEDFRDEDSRLASRVDSRLSPRHNAHTHPSYDYDAGITVAAILSAYPGAGATFASLGLSRALSDSGVSHALIECPGAEPELYSLLDGDRRKPKQAAFADPAGQADPVPAWRQGSAAYYTLDPHTVCSATPDAGFAAWIRRLGVGLVLLDVSSGWDKPGMADWLVRHVHFLWWVADCLPAKWSIRRQEAGALLQAEAARQGVSSRWIANRDHRFEGREEWLTCLPQAPVVKLPQCRIETVVQAAWRGEAPVFDSQTGSAASRAFHNWAMEAIESQGSYHLFHRPNNRVTMKP